jgi:hypothetical protein
MAERNYYGGESVRGSLGLAGSTETLRVKYHEGGVIEEKMFVGAVAVIRRLAAVLGGYERDIVICRRTTVNGALKHLTAGVPIKVVDPEVSQGTFFVLLNGNESAPVIAKSLCRPVEMCRDANKDCGNCCNRKKK